MTARQNIERALRHAGLLDLVTVTDEERDRIYAHPRFTANFLRGLGWTEDPECFAKAFHRGAVQSFREPGAVIPALQVTFLECGTVEIDLDLANPKGGDVASTAIHGLEVAWHWLSGRKSNQQRIARWLDKRFGDA